MHVDMALRNVNRDPSLAVPGVRHKFDAMMENLSNMRMTPDELADPEFADSVLKLKQRYPLRKGPSLSQGANKLHGGKAFNPLSNTQIHKLDALHRSTHGHC